MRFEDGKAVVAFYNEVDVKVVTWTCDRCETPLPGEPFPKLAAVRPSLLESEDKAETWHDVKVHLCQYCMNEVMKVAIGPALRKHLETPQQLNAYSRYEPEVPWSIKVSFGPAGR
jgi:hypothetical protein